MAQQSDTTNEWVFDVTARDFDVRVVNAAVPVLVDFWAPWCGPCRQIAPILDALTRAYAGRLHVAKVNVDEETALASGFGVRSIPYLVIFKNGKVVEELVGVQPEPALRRVLDRHVASASGALAAAARDALRAGDADAALPLLEQARAEAPDDPDLVVDHARCLLALGRSGDAEAMLRELPVDAATTPDVERLGAEIRLAREAEGLRDRASLEALLEAQPADLALRHELARVAAAAHDYDTALEQYLALMRADRDFGDDAGRRGLIGLFDVLGSGDTRVRDYRRRMASLLN